MEFLSYVLHIYVFVCINKPFGKKAHCGVVYNNDRRGNIPVVYHYWLK